MAPRMTNAVRGTVIQRLTQRAERKLPAGSVMRLISAPVSRDRSDLPPFPWISALQRGAAM